MEKKSDDSENTGCKESKYKDGHVHSTDCNTVFMGRIGIKESALVICVNLFSFWHINSINLIIIKITIQSYYQIDMNYY